MTITAGRTARPSDMPARLPPGEGLVAALMARRVTERGARLLVAADPEQARAVIRGEVNSPRSGPPVGDDGEVFVTDREPEEFGCSDCWGYRDPCATCRGWGVVNRYGKAVHTRVFGATAGPSTEHDDDPWAEEPERDGSHWAAAGEPTDEPPF